MTFLQSLNTAYVFFKYKKQVMFHACYMPSPCHPLLFSLYWVKIYCFSLHVLVNDVFETSGSCLDH
jgi:hypothetical protein